MQTASSAAGSPTGRPDRLTPPGAHVVARDGRPVTAHYGSVATEVAVCRKAVGLAFRTELEVLDLQGREPWLERLLTRALGRDPQSGAAMVTAGAWCCRLDVHRAIVVGPSGAIGRWRRVAREAVIGGSPIMSADLTDGYARVSLIGPRAGRLLDAVGLPAGLPLHAIREGLIEDVPVIVVRTAADHWLVLIEADGVGSAYRALCTGGRSLGLSLVGSEAVGRLAAATRPVTAL
jgi:glycine cleavage system aminomethyltransferase T